MEEMDPIQRAVSGAVDRDHDQSAGDGRKTVSDPGNPHSDAARFITFGYVITQKA